MARTGTAFAKQDWTLTAVLEHQAASIGDRLCLCWEATDIKFTFAQVNARVNQVAAGLRSIGIGSGDAVAILMPNCLEYLFLWMALSKIGAIEVPINTDYAGPFLEHPVNTARAKVIAASAGFLETVAASLHRMPQVSTIIVLPDDGGAIPPQRALTAKRVVPFADLVLANTENPQRCSSPADIGAIMFTSGTTGPSKGVMMPHAHLYLFAQLNASGMRLTQDDVCLACLPLFHANAQVLSFYSALIAGARCVLFHRFKATRWIDNVNDTGATVTNLIGSMLPFLLSQPPSAKDKSHAIRAMLVVPADPDTQKKFAARFGAIAFCCGYGQTEIGLPIFLPIAGGEAPPPGASGRLMEDWFEARIVNPDTDEGLETGEVGELVIRPKEAWTISQGYFGAAEQTMKAWRNLWYHTGDALRRDEDGWYFFVDRLKDTIRRRGENISSFEIESQILAHPDVADVAVVAVRSDDGGGEDEVKACVVLNPQASVTHAAIVEWCKDKVPRFAVPRFIEFLPDLPRTPTQKVEKHLLRAKGVTTETWDRLVAEGGGR